MLLEKQVYVWQSGLCAKQPTPPNRKLNLRASPRNRGLQGTSWIYRGPRHRSCQDMTGIDVDRPHSQRMDSRKNQESHKFFHLFSGTADSISGPLNKAVFGRKPTNNIHSIPDHVRRLSCHCWLPYWCALTLQCLYQLVVASLVA